MKNVILLSEMEVRTGIPLRILHICRKLGAEGFNQNSTVNISKFLEWYNVHKDTDPQLSGVEITLDDLKLQDKQMDIKLKKLKEKQMEQELISPDEVKALLIEIGTAQSALLKKIFGELPPRLIGLDEPAMRIIMDKSLQEIFDLLKNKSDKIK